MGKDTLARRRCVRATEEPTHGGYTRARINQYRRSHISDSIMLLPNNARDCASAIVACAEAILLKPDAPNEVLKTRIAT